MIHWPDWTIANALCGFDRDPMQGGATVVAQVTVTDDGTQSTWRTADRDGEITYHSEALKAAQRAAEAAIGGQP